MEDSLRNALAMLSEEITRAHPHLLAIQTAGQSTAFDEILSRIPIEQAKRPEIDKLCMQWVASKSIRWAALGSDELFLMSDRLTEARNFCGWLMDTGFSTPERDTAQVLTWLLIEYWHNLGLLHWRSILKARPPE